MKTFAGEIAAKLQGAHERRRRGEDKDMSSENTPMNLGEGIWDDDPFVRALNLSAELGKVLGDIAASGHAPDENAGRVAELERQLAEAVQGREASDAAANERDGEHEELVQARELLATAYVAREVPWADLGAGMMTIARDGTPWMVESYRLDDAQFVFVLRNGGKTFEKTPTRDETVRVLVPYMTPEAAQAAVREQLGAVPA